MNEIKRYFGTDGIRRLFGVEPMVPDLILKLGLAIGKILKSDNKKILVGKDPRRSGDCLESALSSGLLAAGVDVDLLGVISTPAVSFLTKKLQADAGIIISASHNPYHDNGIKIFDKYGQKISDQTQLEIEEQMFKAFPIADPLNLGKLTIASKEVEKYIEFCIKTFPEDLNLNKIKIIIDCANGANYEIAARVFGSLGAQQELMANVPDGININYNCGSSNPELLIKKVKECKADVGIAFDGDGDRVIFVDNFGQVVDGDDLLFIIANLYIASGKKLTGVIGTDMSNLGLEKALAAMGLSFVRTKVGDRYIFQELAKRSWDLGGESSGHIICRNLHSTGDGIIAALKVLESMLRNNKSLAELLQPMQKYPQVLINVPIKRSSDTQQILNNSVFKKTYNFLTKKLQEHGRVIIRSSGTEPIMRVMVEGIDKNLINNIAKELEQAILGVILSV